MGEWSGRLEDYDAVARWALVEFPDAYGHAGFVYVPTALGGVVALGGDAAFTLGWYRSDDDLVEGDPQGFWEWDDGDDQTAEWVRIVVRHLVRGRTALDHPRGGLVLL